MFTLDVVVIAATTALLKVTFYTAIDDCYDEEKRIL